MFACIEFKELFSSHLWNLYFAGISSKHFSICTSINFSCQTTRNNPTLAPLPQPITAAWRHRSSCRQDIRSAPSNLANHSNDLEAMRSASSRPLMRPDDGKLWPCFLEYPPLLSFLLILRSFCCTHIMRRLRARSVDHRGKDRLYLLLPLGYLVREEELMMPPMAHNMGPQRVSLVQLRPAPHLVDPFPAFSQAFPQRSSQDNLAPPRQYREMSADGSMVPTRGEQALCSNVEKRAIRGESKQI